VRIRFTSSVLSSEEFFPILDVLALLVEAGRHSFDPANIPDILSSEWIKNRSVDLKELIKLSALKRSHDNLVDQSVVTVDDSCRKGGIVDFPNSDTRLAPLDAIQFLTTPFHVIVENEWFDGAFLLWMAKAIDFNRLISAYREGRFVFRHAGGKDAIPRCAAVLSNGVWPRGDAAYSRAMRLWACVFLDSDAKHPADNPNAQIVAEALPNVIFVHQLKKRSIESYIPSHFLSKYDQSAGFRRRVSALGRLTRQQQLYFHMKVGFKHDEPNSPAKASYLASAKVLPQEKALFGGIIDNDWLELMSGFGKKLSEIYVDQRYRPNPNDVNFVDQLDKQELAALTKAIYERL